MAQTLVCVATSKSQTEACATFGTHASGVQHARGMRTSAKRSYEQTISSLVFMSMPDPDFELSGSNTTKRSSEFSFYNCAGFPTLTLEVAQVIWRSVI